MKIVNNNEYNKTEAIVNNYNTINSLLHEDSRNQKYGVLNHSSIVYSNIFDNISLECLLDNNTVINKIKFGSIENSYKLSLMFNVTNLNVKLEESELSFYNLKSGELEYRLMKPYIKCNNNSNNVSTHYKLEKLDNSLSDYILTIEVDLSKYNLTYENDDLTKTQSNDFEIVIAGLTGSSVEQRSSNPIVYDTYVSSTNPTTNYGYAPEVKVSSNNSQIGYFRISKPTIPSGSTINDAFYSIPYYFTTTSSNNVNVGAYEILESWSEGNVTWNSNIDVSYECLDTAYAYASATESSPSYLHLGILEAAKSWYSMYSNNYGIAVKYENGNTPTVLMKSWESYEEVATMTIDYRMTTLIVEVGVYFIKNGHLDKYIQIDDDDSNNNYNSENAFLEVWTGNGSNVQKWIFEYLHNGYYKIKSYNSDKVISIKQGNENSSNDALVQQTYNGSYRQQWKITMTDSGKYKIKARSSENYSIDRVMCIGEGIGEDGRNVEQREYSNNTYYKDEWLLEKIDATIKLIAFDDSDAIRNSYFTPIKNILANIGTTDVSTNYYKFIGKDMMIHYFDNSQIVYAHTHGAQNGIFCGQDWVNSSDLTSVNLSNLELALLLTCNTGIGGYDQDRVSSNSPINFVESMVCRGAKTVVGFSSITYVRDCNVFATEFTRLIVNNSLSVQNAINSIDWDDYIQDMSSIIVIGGNANNQIWF